MKPSDFKVGQKVYYASRYFSGYIGTVEITGIGRKWVHIGEYGAFNPSTMEVIDHDGFIDAYIFASQETHKEYVDTQCVRGLLADVLSRKSKGFTLTQLKQAAGILGIELPEYVDDRGAR